MNVVSDSILSIPIRVADVKGYRVPALFQRGVAAGSNIVLALHNKNIDNPIPFASVLHKMLSYFDWY